MNGCFYCGERMTKRTRNQGPLERTKDHVQPKSRGGHHFMIGNIVHCHRKCNEEKANRNIEQYRKLVADRKGVPVESYLFPGEVNGWGR